jgi:hypothetical protein
MTLTDKQIDELETKLADEFGSAEFRNDGVEGKMLVSNPKNERILIIDFVYYGGFWESRGIEELITNRVRRMMERI